MNEQQRRARRRPGENRERLIEAGLMEFGLFGYHGTSTSAIAARADVPQPHVYANFATKQKLFLACASRLRATLLESADIARAAEPPAAELRFLYQCVACAASPSLRDELLPALSDVRGTVGDERFASLLELGAGHLLRGV